MKKMFTTIILVSLFLFEIGMAEDNSSWDINGQVRLRSEIDGRDFSDQTRALSFTSLRTRISVGKTLNKEVGLFVQFQDSRIYGNEPKTLANTANVDIHQAYVTLTDPFGIPVTVQAGRMEMLYGTERFLGAVGWDYIGRSWDGVKFSFDPGVKIDIFALTQKDPQGYIGNATTKVYPDTLLPNNSFSIYGFWATKEINKSNVVDVFAYYEANRVKTNGIDPDLARATIGVNHLGNYGNLNTIFEAGYQIGDASDKSVSAYLVSLQANYKISTFSVGAGADILSGSDTEDPDVNNAFAPSYATNHKFYGYMDYFINVPKNANNLGLRDIYFMLKWAPDKSKFNFGATYHLFMSDKENSAGENNFGNELDLTINYKFIKGTTITWGGSIFTQGDLMKNKFSEPSEFVKEDTAFWTYVMISAGL